MTPCPEDVPVIPRGVRMHEDRVRDIWVLLAPERTVTLDPIGQAILSEVDGKRSLAEIAARLAARYDAPAEQVATDAAEFLGGLMDRRFMEVA